jgi:hypothetical protein
MERAKPFQQPVNVVHVENAKRRLLVIDDRFECDGPLDAAVSVAQNRVSRKRRPTGEARRGVIQL